MLFTVMLCLLFLNGITPSIWFDLTPLQITEMNENNSDSEKNDSWIVYLTLPWKDSDGNILYYRLFEDVWMIYIFIIFVCLFAIIVQITPKLTLFMRRRMFVC